jgi:glycine dehydrogenase subunit 1
MNNFRYFPNSKKDIARLYRFLGIKDKKELFEKILGDIPLMDAGHMDALPKSADEEALYRFFSDIDSNLPAGNKTSIFAGGGIYNHFVPSVIDSLISRSEFYTPYTPYQPEVSQGTLFALFEFQSMIAKILSMDVVNASMYDGAESLSEAVLMAMRLFGSNGSGGSPEASAVKGGAGSAVDSGTAGDRGHAGDFILVSEGVNPLYFSVIKTFAGGTGVKIKKIRLNAETGQTDIVDLKSQLKSIRGNIGGRVPAVVIQQPNYFGAIEDMEELEPLIHNNGDNSGSISAGGSYFIVSSTEPYSFGAINPPGFYGADIFAGDGNSFGNYMNFGGPLLGLFAAKKEYVRQMPGRIVGKTKDGKKRDAYAFILSTREQHIRRGSATSNICTNSSLNAVRAAIYLSLCSMSGFNEIASLNLKLAHILKEELLKTGLFEQVYSGDFFNEFSLRIKNNKNNKDASAFIGEMAQRGVIAGIAVSEEVILVSATEKNSLSDIKKYAENAKEVLNG